MKKQLLILAIASSIHIHTTAQSGISTFIEDFEISSPVSSLIFDTNFDNKPDWVIQHAAQRYISPGSTAHDGSSGYVAASNIPPGFDFYYTSERWHPNGDKNGNDTVPGFEPVAQINNREGNHLSPNGKSLIITDESYGLPSQWGADAVLTKDLGAEYDELWVEIWVKFKPDFQWESVLNGAGQSAMKFFRVRRYSGISTDNRFSFFGQNARSGSPVAIFDFKEWATSATNSVTRGFFAIRGYSLPSEYNTTEDYFSFKDQYTTKIETGIKQGGENSLSWSEIFGDDQYHKINLYLKMDSIAGAGDGIAEFWLDDILELRVTDIPWREAGDPDIGWNELSIGGNANNVWAPETEHSEQWYSVSSLKVSSDKVVTGIKEQKTIELQVYPNPTSNHLTISGLSPEGQTTVVLSNGIGQQVGEVMSFIGKASVQVNTTYLPEGVYFLTVATNNQRFTARVIR